MVEMATPEGTAFGCELIIVPFAQRKKMDVRFRVPHKEI